MKRTLNIGIVLCENFLSDQQNAVDSYTQVYEDVRMFEFGLKLFQSLPFNIQETLIFCNAEQHKIVDKAAKKYKNTTVFFSRDTDVANVYEAKVFIQEKYKLTQDYKKRGVSSYYDSCCFILIEANRPLTAIKTVKSVYEKALIEKAAIAVLPYNGTLMNGNNDVVFSHLQDKNRFNYWKQSKAYEVQYPQAYTLNKLNQFSKQQFLRARSMLDLMKISNKSPLSIVDGSTYAFRVVTNLDFEILLGILKNG